MKSITRMLFILIFSGIMLLSASCTAYASSGNGSRGGGVVKLSGDIYVNEGNTIEGDVVTLNGNIYINGDVTGNAVTLNGDIIVNGKVLGDAVSISGKITVGEKGKVLGDTVEALGGTFNTRRNTGNRNNYMPPVNPWGRTTSILFSFFTTLGTFLLAALIYLIMPKKVNEMADTIEQNVGKRLGIGILTVLGSPIAMIILTIVLAITIIGIIIIPFAWIAFFIAFLIGVVPVYLYIGKKAAAAVSRPEIASFAALAAGILTVWLVKTAASLGGFFTGWIGWLLTFVLYVLGIGTLIDYIFSNRSKKTQYNYAPYPPYPQQGGGYNPNYNSQNLNYVPKEQESKLEGTNDMTNKEDTQKDNDAR